MTRQLDSLSVRCLLATLTNFVHLRSAVDSGSSQSNNDSDCDSESTESEWNDISDPRRERVGVDNDDDINSGSEPVSKHLSKTKVDNVEQCFCSLLNLSYSTLLVSLVCQCINSNCVFTAGLLRRKTA